MSGIDPHLFGQVVLSQNLVTPEQLEAAEREQFDSGARLGDIFVRQEVLEPDQVRLMRQAVAAELDKDDGWFRQKMADAELARLLCFREVLTSDELTAALRTQALVEAEGGEQSLVDLLLEYGLVAEHQLLGNMTYEVMFCTQCEMIYKVRGFERGYKVKCLTCPVLLSPPPASLESFSDTMDLFIDSKGVRDRELLGQLAIRQGHCGKSEIAHAQGVWHQAMGAKQFGEVLMEEGYVTPEQLSELEKLQRRAADVARDERRVAMSAVKFGEVGVKLGLFTSEMLVSVLRTQMGQDELEDRSLMGELLVARGFLTLRQALRILDLQMKVIVRCPGCEARYNVQLGVSRQLPSCPRCKKGLVALDGDADSLEIAEDLTKVSAS